MNGICAAGSTGTLEAAAGDTGARHSKHRAHLSWVLALLPLFAAGCFEVAEPDGVWFADEAGSRGISFRHVSGAEGRFWTPEIMGGGVALADIDDDGDLDAYFVQSGFPAKETPSPGNELYLNNGRGRFELAGDPGDAADRGYGMGVSAGDYDNDGDVDLYVTNWGANVLLRNDGRGRFDDVTSVAGVGDPGWGTAAAFLDLDGDDDLDLFVVNYLNWSPGSAQDCIRTYCGPSADDATPDRLYRNNGDGTFTDVSTSAGLNAAFGNGLGIAGADFNDDGRIDVFVANDGMANQLWLNDTGPDGVLRFRNEALLWGCAMDDHGFAKAGMGVASADFDDDGATDILVVNLERQTDSFYRNAGTHFVDETSRIGLGVSSRRFTRFGVALADFDNDGDLDMYQGNGRIDHSPEFEGDDPFAEPNVLYRRLGERYEVVPPEGGTRDLLVHTSRGVAMGDVDDDGGVDLVVVNRDAPAYLLMNRVGQSGNWARFRVVNRYGSDAIGATVWATAGTTRQRRSVRPATSYLASHDPRVHFGLGEATGVSGVEVHWPSGETEAFGDFPAGETVVLRHGAAVRQENKRGNGHP